jgi:hypothetical protein
VNSKRGNVYVSTKKWCLKEDTNNIYDKIGNICIIPEIKYIQVHQYSKHQKAPRTMYQISILHPMSKIRIVEDANVDYGTDSNGVKKREPRKNLFSVIKLT